MTVTIETFRPEKSFTVTAATPTPGRVKVKDISDGIRTLRVYNPSTNGDIYIAFGDSTVVASSASMRVGPTPESFSMAVSETHVSVLSDSGSFTVYLTIGQGA